MASTGKKSKKVKGVTLNLNDFLATIPSAYVTKSWAEEDDDVDSGHSSRPRGPVVLPSASRANRESACDEDSIPRNGPFVAYISNLPYEEDEESISELFQGLKVSNLRLPSMGDGKLKGFGYVDFDDRESLIAALNLVDPVLNGRAIKISLANSDDRRGGRRNDRDRDRDYDPDKFSGNWRNTQTEPETGRDGNRREWGSYGRDRDRGREPAVIDNTPGGWRNNDEPPPRENRAYGGRGSYGDRERGYQRDGDRGGYGRDSDRGGYGRDRDGDRGGYGRDRDRENWDRDKGQNRDKERDWDRDKGSERGYRGGDYGRDRPRDSDRSFTRRDYGQEKDRDRDSDPDKEPVQRPKLQLKPRTIPLENPPPPQPVSRPESEKGGDTGGESSEKEESERKKPQAPKPAANIFGSAKPVDTTAKEREIEERLAKKSVETKYKEAPVKDKEDRKPWGRDKRGDKDDDDRKPRRSDDKRDDRREDRRPAVRGSRDNYRDSKDSRDNRESNSRERRDYSDNRDREERDRRKDEEKDRRRDEERVMPKAKEQPPPNFVASNKFSSLENADAEEEGSD